MSSLLMGTPDRPQPQEDRGRVTNAQAPWTCGRTARPRRADLVLRAGAAPRDRSRGLPDLDRRESKALAKELKRRGFVFVGPTTAYA